MISLAVEKKNQIRLSLTVFVSFNGSVSSNSLWQKWNILEQQMYVAVRDLKFDYSAARKLSHSAIPH